MTGGAEDAEPASTTAEQTTTTAEGTAEATAFCQALAPVVEIEEGSPPTVEDVAAIQNLGDEVPTDLAAAHPVLVDIAETSAEIDPDDADAVS